MFETVAGFTRDFNDADEFMPLDNDTQLIPEEHFICKVVGSSMTELGITDGCTCLIKRQPTINNGDIALIVIDGRSTLKQIYMHDKKIELRWRDGSRRIETIIKGDVRIVGLFVKVIN